MQFQPPKIMGILNVTPDSFFDGGKHLDIDAAVKQAYHLLDQGADILDVGGESTKPGSIRVTEEIELSRVVPLLEEIGPKFPIPISIDTQTFGVAKRAVELGATIINDVSGFSDPRMVSLASDSKATVCVLHRNPGIQIKSKTQENFLNELILWFEKRIERLIFSDIDPSKIIIDPGITFGKSIPSKIEIYKSLSELKKLGYRLLIGGSRALGRLANRSKDNSLNVTVILNTIATLGGADIIRVHDVKEHLDLVEILKHFYK